MEFIDIVLQGKEYKVSCELEKKEDLIAASTFLNERLDELGAKTRATGEKLAMMTALNIAYDFLQLQRGNGFDMPETKRRIKLMTEQLETLLEKQEKLF